MMMKLQKKVLEINPEHPLISGLLDKLSEFASDEEAQADEDLNELVDVLYDTSLVRSGFSVRDPTDYFGRVESILRRSLGVSETAKAGGKVKPAPQVETGPVKPKEQKMEGMPEGGDFSGAEWANWRDRESFHSATDLTESD